MMREWLLRFQEWREERRYYKRLRQAARKAKREGNKYPNLVAFLKVREENIAANTRKWTGE